MTRIKGPLALGVAVVLCPCHLPIIAAVLGGTMLGAAIAENLALVVPLTIIGFTAALILGWRWITREDAPACDSCETPIQVAAAKGTRMEAEISLGQENQRADERQPVASPR